MAADSPWPIIHVERRALIADLTDLPAERWDTPSLCPGWSVRDVLGHLTATARMTPLRFFRHFALAGFRFDRMTARDVAAETAVSPSEQLAAFRSLVDASTAPPGPVVAMLGEIIVHSEDIRRPLGISHGFPVEAVIEAADFYRRSNLLIGAKRRIEGLTLRATDVGWHTGTGPEVVGPALSLLMVMTGRPATEDLSGDGLQILADRR